MGIKPSKFYNEPLTGPRGDVMPKIRRPTMPSLSPVVRTRIQLEASLRVCGVDPAPKVIKFTAIHRRVLLAMLSEVDSPLSASLRARAADVAGTLRIREAAPALRRMALDEQEDLQTRLSSVRSYLSIRGNSAAGDVKILLRSRELLVRVSAYITALQSKEAKLRAIAEEQFRVEKVQRVKRMVVRRVPRLQRTEMTKDDM